MSTMTIRIHLFLAAALVLVAPALSYGEESASTVRVMSFNIRYGSANDGENHWNRRKEFLAETIRNFGPDLLGTQETELAQKEYLADQLPEYTAFGAGRVDGKNQGEMSAIFYRTKRFRKLDGGHFWLSETPAEPGSKSWDSSLPRMVTWVKLEDQEAAGKPVIWYFNTHLDHRGKQARLESAKLIHKRVSELPEGARVIVTGDFNCGEGSEPYLALFASRDERGVLVDAFRRKFPERKPDEGTFNNFRPEQRSGARIDWIAISPQWHVEDFVVNYVTKDGRVPSDHFPLEAVLKY